MIFIKLFKNKNISQLFSKYTSNFNNKESIIKKLGISIPVESAADLDSVQLNIIYNENSKYENKKITYKFFIGENGEPEFKRIDE